MDGKKIAGLVLTVAVSLFFILPNGLGKLFGVMGIDVVELAEMYGYSVGFMKVIGTLELLGGVGLLLPQTRKLAALGLVGLMMGAIVSHIRAPDTLGLLPMPIAVMVVLGLIIKMAGGMGPPAADA